jgi:hypothetical protein
MSYQLVAAVTEVRDAGRCVYRARNTVAVAIASAGFAAGFAVGVAILSAGSAQPEILTAAKLPSSTAADALCSNVYRAHAQWGGSLNAFVDCVDHQAGVGVTNLE